jgi:hypothetical protein
MDLSFFTTPTGIAVIAAVGSFIAGVVGAGISSWTIRRTHSQRLAAVCDDRRTAEGSRCMDDRVQRGPATSGTLLLRQDADANIP